MATAIDIGTALRGYVDDLNAAVKSRDFPAFVGKWFADECTLNFHHDTRGLANAERLLGHLLPKGGDVPREVQQFPYKVQNGRVYCWRFLHGGNAPRPLYGLQETQFDDRMLISEISIRSVADKPKVDEEPGVATSRHALIFLAFASVFNEYFKTGNWSLIKDWFSPDVRFVVDSTFWNKGVIMPHNRIQQSATFMLKEWKQLDAGRVRAQVEFTNWGGLDAASPWEVALTPNGKVRELVITLEM
jgi:hypothetical protein